MKQRIEFIDLAKGICISLVVLLHVYGDLSGTVIKIMNLFRMPLYFVLSGLFFKTYDGWIPFFKKKTNKLLIPFLFTFLFIIIPSSYLLNIKDGVEVSLSELIYGGYGKFNLGIDGAIWFLICLFALNIFFYLIFLISRQNIIAICILSCLCGIAGYMINCYNCYLPMWFDSALTAMPFFMIGYVMRNYSNILYENITKKDYILCSIMFLVLIGAYFYDEWQGTGAIAYGSNTFDISIITLYSGGVAGTFCILIISKYFKHILGISYIGRYSIVVLLTHLIYMFIIRNLLYQLRISQESISLNLLVFITIMLLELPTIKFCISHLPYFFAQKDIWK
jgi:fucose 4-O-acetylase-like acetyltransferase